MATETGIDDDDRPLAGLRVVEIATYVAGPSGAMTLGQLGADVIRIDPIGGAPDTRRLPVDAAGHSLYWAGLNKAKRSVELDLSRPEGRQLATALVAAPGPGAGILLTNAVGQGWLAYEELARARADLIHVHILGRSDGLPAVDYTVNCEVGLPMLTGPAELAVPVNHVLPAWDLLAGVHAALAILVAERARTRSGRGRSVRIALADVATATMAHLGYVGEVAINGAGRPRDGNYLYGSFGRDFRTADGERVMVVALTPRHWRSLVDTTGQRPAVEALEGALGVDFSDEAARYRHREALAGLVAPWFAARNLEDVLAVLGDAQLLVGRYRSVEDLVGDASSLLGSTGLFARVEQPGIGTYPTPRALFLGADAPPPAPAPLLGAHTDEVLGELLGLAPDALDRLRSERVIGGAA